jgi:hypothetical protein
MGGLEMKTIAILTAALSLAACGKAGVATETRIQIEKVPVPAKCPDAKTYAAIVAKRPVRLSDQPMPATAQERTAKTAAQLGRYEARGGWADDVQAVLDRCQQGED